MQMMKRIESSNFFGCFSTKKKRFNRRFDPEGVRYSNFYMTRTDPSNYSTKFVCSGYYLRILISIGKGCEGYVPDLIFPSTTKTLKVAAHTTWLMVSWSLSYLDICTSRKRSRTTTKDSPASVWRFYTNKSHEETPNNVSRNI